MTILSKNQPIRCDLRFTFGVPLEDVFPGGDIHPSLKNLLLAIFESVYFSRVPLKHYLRDERNSRVESVRLRAILERCKPIDLMPLETLFYTLRHFLGSLPLPLLPKYTDGRYFVWLKLAQRCQNYLRMHFHAEETNQYLIELITDDLLKLPSVNLLLIGYLMNFFRSLVFAQNGKLNKSSASALINYFCPSMMHHKLHSQELYKSLIFYMLIKWPNLQLRCVQKSSLCFTAAAARRDPGIRDLEVIEEFIGNQDGSTGESFNDIEPVASVSSDSFVTLPDNEYLKDSQMQTDIIEEVKSISTQTDRVHSVSTQTSPKAVPGKWKRSSSFVLCCESVSTQIEEAFFKSSPKSSQESDNSYVKFSDEDDYFFDDDYKKKAELVERVSQIGWSYTPPAKETPLGKDTSNWKIPKEDYKICFEKSVDVTSNIPGCANEDNISFDESNAQTPLNRTKSRKSLSNFSAKLRSKLDLLKTFKARKLSKSASEEKVGVKYEKMDGAKSTLF